MKKALNRIILVLLSVVASVSALALTSVTATAATGYDYEIKVKTGTNAGSGTDADVYLYAYNDEGKLIGSRIRLDTEGNSFENGDIDVIDITLPEKIESIKVAILHHTGNMFENLANSANEWYLEYIQVSHIGETRTYFFNEWIEPGVYAHTKTIRDRHSFPKLSYEKVPEKVTIYSPSSVN